MKYRARADDQEGYVRVAYGETPGRALDRLCQEMDFDEEEDGHTIRWIIANQGFLTFEEVPDGTDESDAG